MNSIGNDIVDFKFIDKARTQSKPFYSKILSEPEQALYQTHFSTLSFWQYVWLLWSCKEAVYKFLKRHQAELVFSPVKISLKPEFSELKNFYNSSIQIKFCFYGNSTNSGSDIFCSSVITENYIHTVAYMGSNFEGINQGVQHIDHTVSEHQSIGVRQLVSEKLNESFPGDTITFGKADAGFPIILQNGTDSGILASFAHHGNYVAYAFKRA